MRKIPLILGLALLAVLTAWEAYDFLITNDSVGYFTSHPRRLVYVVAIGVGGGLLALGFSRLSPLARRMLRLAALGGFGACVTAFLAIFAARLTSFAPMVTDAGMWGWVIAALTSLSVIAVWCGWSSIWFGDDMRPSPNHAPQRTRPLRSGCNPRVLRAGSLTLGR